MKNIIKNPLTWILVFCTALFAVGITWGLPNSEDWLSDSLAPFHPLIGLSKAFSFGYFNKYPIVHQVILAVLNLPVLIAAFINSNPLEGLQIMKFLVLMRSPEYATWLILIDRLVSLVMGVLTVYIVFIIAEEVFGSRAGIYAALIASFNAVLNFYARVAKVEVPYVFWGLLGIYMLVRIVKYERTRDYVWCAVFTCLSFGSKDQGYAIFILPFVFYLVVYQAVARKEGEGLFGTIFRKNMWIFGAAFIIGTVLVENVILNWDGFLQRYNELTGWSGQRSISYTLGAAGLTALFLDSMKGIMRTGMGEPFFLVSLAGVVMVICRYRKDGKGLFFRMMFLAAFFSYYFFFIQPIRQSSVRYFLPGSLFLTIYGGYALDYIHERAKGVWTGAFAAALALACVFSFYNTFSVNMNFLRDTRYRAEAWMNENMPRGATIEYYAYLHYLPRFPDGTEAYRIKSGVLDIESRKPDYIVLTSHYYPRFLGAREGKVVEGRITVTQKLSKFRKTEFPEYLDALFNNRLRYRLEKRFDRDLPFFKIIHHARISPDHILIYKRVSAAGDGKPDLAGVRGGVHGGVK